LKPGGFGEAQIFTHHVSLKIGNQLDIFKSYQKDLSNV
jgi:hypothetical protein